MMSLQKTRLNSIAQWYAAGNTMQSTLKKFKCGYDVFRQALAENDVEIRHRGQQYMLPDKQQFEKDCEELRWFDLENKYGVSWSIIKYWKRRYGLTNGKKNDRKVMYTVESNGCWCCDSHAASKGYPRGRGGGLISKRMWEDKFERKWPVDKICRHLCNNRWCINPEHIFPGTQFENIVDMYLDDCFKESKTITGARMDGVLTKAYRLGIIILDEEGFVIRTADKKKFNIKGTVEKKVVMRYKGTFSRKRSVPELELSGGEASEPAAGMRQV